MDTSRSLTTEIRVAILLAPAFLTKAACASEEAVRPRRRQPPPRPSPTTTAISSQPTFCSGCVRSTEYKGLNSDTGIAAGPIAAPPSATFGTARDTDRASRRADLPRQQRRLDSANITFPLITTGLQAASTGMSAITGSRGATATVVSTSATSSTLQLVVPSANINATISGRESLVGSGLGDAPTWGYSYVVLGEWAQRSGAGNNSGPIQKSGRIMPSDMTHARQPRCPPKGRRFLGIMPMPWFSNQSPSTTLSTYLDGTAAVTVNFASGQVTGAIALWLQYDGIPYGGPNNPIGYLPWNDVSVNANIATGTNRFSGSNRRDLGAWHGPSVSPVRPPAMSMARFTARRRRILGAVWSLSDGTISAIGTLGAKQ